MVQIREFNKIKSYEKFQEFSPDGSFIIYQGWNETKWTFFLESYLVKY